MVPPGEYPFAVYQWRKVGILSDDTLVTVTSDPKLNGTVLSLLETATDAPAGTTLDESEIGRLETRHHSEWQSARANHMVENRKLVQHRHQSLHTSHQARCKLLEDQSRHNAMNDNIHRMKEGELARANYDYERRVADLERLTENPDIYTTLIVEGMLRITREDVA